MKKYKVKVMPEVKLQLRSYLGYIRNRKKNIQAYEAVKKDFEDTIKSLENVAGSMKDCENTILSIRGLKKIKFKKHDYVLLYRIRDDIAEVVAMYHTMEDYENKIR